MGDNASNPRLIAGPADALIDESISVRAEGLAPDATAAIRAVLRNDDATVRWSSEITVIAAADGTIDLSAQAPDSGSYTSIDPNGLIWSMLPEAGSAGGRNAATGLEPLTLDLTLQVDGVEVDSAQLIRRSVAPSVIRRDVRQDGLFINLFLPDAKEATSRPTIVVLGGSGGGFSDSLAALYASHGYAAVSVAYFAIEGLPPELINIPLEYFEQVLAWVIAQPELDADHLAVTGISRGAELALLLASRYPILRNVVAYVPSGYIWGAVSPSESDDPDAFPSWTYGGNPIPYVARIRNDAAAPNADGIVDLTPAFHKALENETRAEQATIEVERINGPVLLISGRDDALWPSGDFADRIVERLRTRGFDFDVQSFAYDGAGHTIGAPITPATITEGFHPIRKVTIGYGGTPEAIAAARADSWPRVLAFLDTHVKSRSLAASAR